MTLFFLLLSGQYVQSPRQVLQWPSLVLGSVLCCCIDNHFNGKDLSSIFGLLYYGRSSFVLFCFFFENLVVLV